MCKGFFVGTIIIEEDWLGVIKFEVRCGKPKKICRSSSIGRIPKKKIEVRAITSAIKRSPHAYYQPHIHFHSSLNLLM